MKYNDEEKILKSIMCNINLFDSFSSVYLFGSILQSSKKPHDIDILLIYSVYSEQVTKSANNILSILNKESELPIDLTVLSVSEEKEIKFIEKQNLNYLKIK
ncbi:MAG: hypothetical protein PHC64_04790 [Candidatus Gastranaerophilales bacterium]|nr:hypothetical protein [Candidatus Gastranaerophilales bacterium]